MANEYIKIGRINMTRAKEAHIQAADIKINRNHIEHVAGEHQKELEYLGVSALDFINMIVNNYNEIRAAKDGTYFLAHVLDEKHTNTAIIGLNYNEKKEFWEIKTAIPIRTAVFKKKKLVWKRERTPIRL